MTDHASKPQHGFPMLTLVLLVLEFALVTACGLAYMSGAQLWGFAFVGIFCSWITHLPFLLREARLISMWGALSFVVTVGAGVRGLMVATGYPNRAVLNALFLQGIPFEQLWGAAVVTVASICTLTMGFLATRSNRRGDGPPSHASLLPLPARALSPRGMRLLIAGYAVVGFVSTCAYYFAVGGSSASISDRRTTFVNSSQYESYGVLEFVASAGTIALLLYLAYRLETRPKWSPLALTILAVLVVNALAISWITTTRASILYVIVGALLVVRIVRQRVNVALILSCVVVAIVGIGALTAVRAGPDGAGHDRFSLSLGVESGLLNRNAFDLSKTLIIIDAVPERLPHANGLTIANYLIAPVPRAVWPDKPAISPGPMVGETLYGLERTGVPPGVVAELVWNFGRATAIVGCGFLGAALGRLERSIDRLARDDVLATLTYAFAVLPFAQGIMGVAIGQALSAAAQGFALLAPLALVAALLRRPASPGSVARRRATVGRSSRRRGPDRPYSHVAP